MKRCFGDIELSSSAVFYGKAIPVALRMDGGIHNSNESMSRLLGRQHLRHRLLPPTASLAASISVSPQAVPLLLSSNKAIAAYSTITTTTMKFGTKPLALFLCLASQDFTTSSAFRPLSFGSHTTISSRSLEKKSLHSLTKSNNQQQCPATTAMSAHSVWTQIQRGGSSTALNSAVASQEAMMAPTEIFRTDYDPLPHVVSKINMNFVIEEGVTKVISELTIEPNDRYTSGTSQDMVLDGDESCVKLLAITMNGNALEEGTDYTLEPGKLILKSPPAGAVLETTVELVPEENTQLSGLYKSGSMYCTQCEAMGFRRITYYPDRPDNMAVFEKVRLEADAESYPILLANGNLVESGDLDNGRHYAVWSDPYPKPSYLFCCVAGNLGKIQDSYTTTSGREVTLQVFSEPRDANKLDYAMESLKRSMKWDEDKYGLEYDLDLFNIVAVDSFNMGAMENKVRVCVCVCVNGHAVPTI
jgi:hypothetical protein